MRSRKVTRYYCDHCSKGKFHRPAMEKHELSCTMNPNRVCRMCKMAQIEQKTLSALIPLLPVFNTENPDPGKGEAIRAATNGCPACILAAIRQSTGGSHMAFYWKDESKAWIKEHSHCLSVEDFG